MIEIRFGIVQSPRSCDGGSDATVTAAVTLRSLGDSAAAGWGRDLAARHLVMPTLFTRIIEGDLPGRFVWRDAEAVAFLTISPIRPGHTLIVPRLEVDNWLDLAPEVAAHLMNVAQTIGQAQRAAFVGERIGLIIAGLEVPHVHLHTIPIASEADLDFSRADPHPDDSALDRAAGQIREALRAAGRPEVAES